MQATRNVSQLPTEAQLTDELAQQIDQLTEYVRRRQAQDVAELRRACRDTYDPFAQDTQITARADISAELLVAGELLQSSEITQLELGLFISLRTRLDELQQRVAWHEQRFTERLQAGAVVEAGPLHAAVKVTERRIVAWKDVTRRLAERFQIDGETYCAAILEHTPPTRSTRLVVEAR